MSLDLIQTIGFAGLTLFLGYLLKRQLPVLARYNIPAPVVGALPIAALFAFINRGTPPLIAFDTALQVPMQNAFFASVGFGASLRVLARGGPLVLVMMVVASIAAGLQNVVGGAVAWLLGEDPLLGVLAGSVTLTGGPATGIAFAPLFERAGIAGAETLAVSAAMGGIVAGGLMGGPIAAFLLGRRPAVLPRRPSVTLETLAEGRMADPPAATPAGEDVESYSLLKHLVVLLVAIGAGGWVSAGFASMGWTLPAYIGAMIVAAVIRNVDDAVGAIGISQRTIDDLGTVALSIFLAMALMTLRLWQLAGAVLPLLVILAAQLVLVALLCVFVVPRVMGRDYDAVVMSSGFCGFMLGTTANAVANMGALVERYGPAPKAYLVVPLVGAFGIDFINALLITGIVNWWGG